MRTKLAFHWQILIAMALGLALGLALNHQLLPGNTAWRTSLELIGQLFLNGLKLLVIPLVMSSMIVGIASIGEGLGRLGRRTALVYLTTTTAAILTGLLFVNLLTPGLVDGQPAGHLLALPADTAGALAKVEGKSLADLLSIVRDLVPANLVQAMVEGNLLGLITFSLLFGFCLRQLSPALRSAQLNFWTGLQEIMIGMTHVVLAVAPVGVFALISVTVAKTGFAAMAPLALFMATVLLALGLHLFGTLSLLLRLVARVSPRQHLAAMLPALLTGFSTASSNATLPVNLRCLRERAGVSERVTGLTVPLGATVNMNGTALYECVAALFLAQAYGLQLSFLTQALVVLIALVTSIGVAGIPAASLVAIAIILGALGLPLDALGILLITDRFLDMCRTAVNVYDDSVAAVVVAHHEGEALPALRPKTTTPA